MPNGRRLCLVWDFKTSLERIAIHVLDSQTSVERRIADVLDSKLSPKPRKSPILDSETSRERINADDSDLQTAVERGNDGIWESGTEDFRGFAMKLDSETAIAMRSRDVLNPESAAFRGKPVNGA